MKYALISFCLLFAQLASASEFYQLGNAIGNWATSAGPFRDVALQIVASGDGKSIAIRYCDPFRLQTNRTCLQLRFYTGVGTYLSVTDEIQVVEGPYSPNPRYRMRISRDNPNVLLRDWGTSTIRYRRFR